MEYVFRVFGRGNPELLLLHVSRGVDLAEFGMEGETLETSWFEHARSELKRAERTMTTSLESWIGCLERQDADVSRTKTKIVPGVYSRAAAIFGETQDEGCGTIVLERRGLSRVEEFSIGRVSNKVLQLARDMGVWVLHSGCNGKCCLNQTWIHVSRSWSKRKAELAATPSKTAT
jgi:Universal stress protein family